MRSEKGGEETVLARARLAEETGRERAGEARAQIPQTGAET